MHSDSAITALKKPSQGSQFFLLAIILSLSLHAIGLLVMLVIPASSGKKSDELTTLVDFIEISEIPEEKIPESMRQDVLAEELTEVRNVEANMEKARSFEAISSRSAERISDDVYSKLKNFEKEIFDQLSENRKDAPKDAPKEKEYKNEREMYDMSAHDKSYAAATVSYKLEGREGKFLPVPGYKCKVSGKVTVNIEVDPQGKLLSASLNEAETTTQNECLRAEALDYAKRSSFFAKPDAPKKQAGFIVYLFFAQ
jgi:hypothetical protein